MFKVSKIFAQCVKPNCFNFMVFEHWENEDLLTKCLEALIEKKWNVIENNKGRED